MNDDQSYRTALLAVVVVCQVPYLARDQQEKESINGGYTRKPTTPREVYYVWKQSSVLFFEFRTGIVVRGKTERSFVTHTHTHDYILTCTAWKCC